MDYPHLLSELPLAHTKLANRLIMGSMHTNLEEQENGFERLAEFYRLRAEGGVGLIITGGVAPNKSGNLAPNRVIFTSEQQIPQHKLVTDAVRQYDTKICLQILHAGRYSYTDNSVAPSAIQAPINMYTPKALNENEIEQQIQDFIRCASLAHKAGYHGVELMGSEGYLINQFICKKTNKRTDKWGGSYDNRLRFPLEIVKRIRASLPKDFLIIFRLSLLDLVEDGSNVTEVIDFAQQLEKFGIDILNTGIGWHEARVPTIASMVPKGAFTSITGKVKQHITIPIIACNRINSPEIAEKILSNGEADLISMARPFLADSHIINKIENNKRASIAPCIACNQACLDKIFVNEVASCLVNPFACHETKIKLEPTNLPKRLAVVGAGVAGSMFALYAHKKGHHVTLFEQSSVLGGQLNLAAKIPGKEDFGDFTQYIRHELTNANIELRLSSSPSKEILEAFDEVIIASGVSPRLPNIANIDTPKVVTYTDFITQNINTGNDVAIIGSGGIAFDVASKIIAMQQNNLSDKSAFANYWGIDLSNQTQGGLNKKTAINNAITINMVQRSVKKPGSGLGPTSVWIHREEFKRYGVRFHKVREYVSVDETGLNVTTRQGEKQIKADTVIICAGQEENVNSQWLTINKPTHFIGGAYNAKGINAQKAVEQALKLACDI